VVINLTTKACLITDGRHHLPLDPGDKLDFLPYATPLNVLRLKNNEISAL